MHLIGVKKEKFSRYRPGVVQSLGRGIALLFHDRGCRRGWVVSSTPRPHFTPWKDPVPILQEAGWSPGPVWTGGKSRPHRDFIFVRIWLYSVFYDIYTRNIIGTRNVLVMFYCLLCSDVCSLGNCVTSWTSTLPVSSVMWLSDIPIS